jgi:putative membrane protein
MGFNKIALWIIFSALANWVAVLIAQKFIEGFRVTDDFKSLIEVIVLLTLANSVIMPMLRIILKPFIWVTLGLLAVTVNGVLIYLVDIFSEGLTITGTLPLIYATLIIGFVNAVFALGAKAFK